MRLTLGCAALFLVSLSTFAANLSNEIPLGSAALQPAPGTHSVLNLASDGTRFLATWTDTRGTFQNFGSDPMYAGRIDPNGVPSTNVRVSITAPLTWNGSSYVIAYSSGTSGYLQSLDPDGNPSGSARPIDLSATPRQIASNGTTLLAVQPDGSALVDSLATGHAISLRPIAPGFITTSVPVLLSNGDYAFVVAPGGCSSSPCQLPVTLVVVDGTSGVMTTQALVNMPGPSLLSLAVLDDTLLVGWREDAVAKYALFDRTGRAIAPPVAIQQPAGTGAGSAIAASDGRQFLLAVSRMNVDGYSGALVAYRISATGQLLDPNGVTISNARPQDIEFARANGSVALVWDQRASVDDTYHAVTRAAADFDALLTAQTHALAMSAAPQEWPRLADGGGLAAWREGSSIVAQTFGAPAVVLGTGNLPTAPAVARASGCYLVVWSTANASNVTVSAMRVSLDGKPLDAAPIAIATADSLWFPNVLGPSVASDGTNFFVIWPDLGVLHGVRLGQDGHRLDTAPIMITAAKYIDAALIARVVWTGQQYVVVSLEPIVLNILISPVPPAPSLLRLVRVAASGTVIDTAPPILWQSAPADSIGVAVTGSGVAALWNGWSDLTFNAQRCLWATRMNGSGSMAIAPRELECTAPTYPSRFASVDLAWSGSELVAVWSNDAMHVVMAQRFDTSLQPIDAQPFAVSPPFAIAGEPSIAPTPNGAAIAYVRIADEAPYGGVPRAFVRILDRGGVAPHKHAVGR